MTPIPIDDRTSVLVLTGAGVSAESGIPTFRDAAGLWETHAVEEVASPQGFAADPALVWRFYAQRRAGAAAVAPNAGHHALVALEKRLGDRFLLATQNVDDLHRRAGTERLVEMHGNLFVSRCSRCDRPPFRDPDPHPAPPECETCRAKGRKALLRPHIVWFGETLQPSNLRRIAAFMDRARRDRFVFLAVGTSGTVWPAAGLVDDARARGAETWLVNAEPPENAHRFHQFVQGPSGSVLPALLG